MFAHRCASRNLFAGLFDKTGAQVTELINAPNPISFEVALGGEKFSLSSMDALDHRRVLDMKKGTLSRDTLFKTTIGQKKVRYQSLRFFSMHNAHLAAMQVKLTAISHRMSFSIRSSVDTSVSNMGMAKGCDVTIKSMCFVLNRFPDALLVLAGTKNIIDWNNTQEKEIAYFVDLIRALDMTDNTSIDVFSLEEMPEMYRASDVVVYPSSVAEPFGLAMIEAFASERPVIVTNMGRMPEVVQDGINGYVIPQRDLNALSSRLISILGDDALRDRLGRSGRENAQGHYTKDIMTKRHLEVYAKVLGKKTRTRKTPHTSLDKQEPKLASV